MRKKTKGYDKQVIGEFSNTLLERQDIAGIAQSKRLRFGEDAAMQSRQKVKNDLSDTFIISLTLLAFLIVPRLIFRQQTAILGL